MAKFKILKSTNTKPPNQKSCTYKVFVVDDDKDIHLITKAVLKKFEFKGCGIEILSAYSAKEALQTLKQHPDIAVMFLDVVMESDNAGLEIIPIIRNELKNTDIRIILRTGQPGFAPEKDVIRDYDINDYKEKTELTATKLYTTLMASLRSYENIKSIKALNKEIIDTQSEIIKRIGNTVESRSKEIGNHVQRVALLSYRLAKYYELSEEEATKIKLASPMHDLGKIGISDSILLKPGRFNEYEFEEMKKHTQIGFEILDGSNRDILKTASIIAHEHHERYDGSGYPRGLKGDEISIYGRITAIADVFDALSQNRVYKKAWALEDILSLLKKEKGRHFDPKLIDLFFENLDEILKDIKVS